MRPAANTRPVSVLSGFLGSGKTTLLNALLRDPRLTDTAVIVNEFGEIGLDHLLVESAYDDMVLMDNGCLCCSVRGDLADTLRDLDRRAAAGEIPPFGRVMIETTGLADPGPISQTLVLDEGLVGRFVLQGVVVTVDALHGAATLATYPEARAQLGMADLVVVTKSDLLAAGQGGGIDAAIRALNPQAPVLRAVNGALDPAVILALDPTRVTLPEDAGHHPHHHHRHAHETGRIETAALILPGPQEWDLLAGWLEWMTALRGPDILRIKGIVEVAGLSGPVLIHGVQHVFSPPKVLPDWPDDDHRSRMIVIARDVPAAAIHAGWARWQTAGEARRAVLHGAGP